MTILCEPDEKTAESLVLLLDDGVQTVTDLPAAALTISLDPAQEIVVVGSELGIDDVLSFSGQVKRERPDVRVILLRDAVSDELLAAAQDAGIRAVVSSGDPQQLSDAYYAARHGNGPGAPDVQPQFEGAPMPPPRGRTITVFSSKGGTGRTTIATNLAAALNANGRRRVCVIDLDLAFGDVAITMSLAPTRTIVDAVAPDQPGTPDDHLNAMITPYGPGFDTILAPVVPGDDEAVPVGLVRFVLRQMALRYEFVVIDTPARFSEHVLAALDESDVHLLIATPSIPALKNLRLTLDMLDVLSYPPQSRAVVLNQADTRLGITPEQVSGAVRGPVAAQVPYSKDVAVSVNEGKPLVVSKPDHPFSQAVRQVAEAIAGVPTSAQGRRRIGRRDAKARNQSA